MDKPIDLRSDTLTIPSREMLEAIIDAPLGDSLRGEDPSVKRLEKMSASLFGKEDALLLISGTMANQVAIGALPDRGAWIIASEASHLHRKERESISLIWGMETVTLPGKGPFLDNERLEAVLEEEGPRGGGRVRFVSVENSLNAPGGLVYPMDMIKKSRKICKDMGVHLHVDGSRVFNALIEEGTSPQTMGMLCDSLMFCLSKGLGGPLGSVLVGESDFIDGAREARNLLGGGMRQAGIIAACGIYALENNIDRLVEDHEKARRFASIVSSAGGLRVVNDPVQTNMVLFELDETGSMDQFRDELENAGVLLDFRRDPLVRAVTSLNHSMSEVESAAKIVTGIVQR